MLANNEFTKIDYVLRKPIGESFMFGVYSNRRSYDEIMDIKNSNKL